MKVLVKVSLFKGAKVKANKNGKMPLWLTYLSGDSLPSDCLVVDGTIAEQAGIKEGETQVLSISKTGEREFNGTLRNTYSYTTVDNKTAAQFFQKTLEVSNEQGVLPITARTPVTTTSVGN